MVLTNRPGPGVEAAAAPVASLRREAEESALAPRCHVVRGGYALLKLRNRNADVGPAPAPPLEGQGPEGAERATFAAGCFWGVEAAFRQINGVLQTAVGYTGGHVPEPTYDRVCRGRTGHAEAVEVWFDPAQVSYEQLLQTFWRIHNPTSRNRQGFDFGRQYRSAIFYHDAGQQEAATASRDAEQQSVRRQIVTQITPASAFYRAEEYHQRYLEKHGRTSRAATIR
jgi:peptide-methionine (S)-S-oxide reductase